MSILTHTVLVLSGVPFVKPKALGLLWFLHSFRGGRRPGARTTSRRAAKESPQSRACGSARLLASLAAIVLVTGGAFAADADTAEVVTPTEPIRLLEQPREAFRFHIAPHTAVDPALTAEDVFQLDGKGGLTVTGQTWGYMRTAKRYRDYRLELEYRFTGPTSGKREKRARDSGLLLHCFGKDGSRSKTWLPCIEVQIMEGATGDFIVLGPWDDDRNLLPLHLESTGKYEAAKVPYHDPKGERIVLPQDRPFGNAIFWMGRDRAYQEVTGWHADTDADFPTGEKWNRLEVVCDGDEITVHLNGRLVNRARNVSPTVGFLGIQSEGATVEYRNWVLHPLGGKTTGQ